MVSKFLERKVELLPNDGTISFKSPVELEYYLLESIASDFEELNGKKVYGIEIIKKVDNMLVEEKYVKNFSCCKENTKAVLNKLANNTVTPAGLPFILDDMIGI